MPSKPTITQLRKFSADWQARLGLLDWDIIVKWATAQDFADGDCGEDCEGSCIWQVEYHKAFIMLNKKLCDNPFSTIIHEQLHILFEQSDNPKKRYLPHYERGLNIVAELLNAADIL
jgi:hypothetical protein